MRPARLAALVTLARQFGVEALDLACVARRCGRPWKGALATDLATSAGLLVRAELPYWLFLALDWDERGRRGRCWQRSPNRAPLDLRVNLIKAFA